jgi:hypothetical protein
MLRKTLQFRGYFEKILSNAVVFRENKGRIIRPLILNFAKSLFDRRTVGARLRTGAAVLEVVNSVGDIQAVIITTGVDISAIMPSGARRAIRIA